MQKIDHTPPALAEGHPQRACDPSSRAERSLTIATARREPHPPRRSAPTRILSLILTCMLLRRHLILSLTPLLVACFGGEESQRVRTEGSSEVRQAARLCDQGLVIACNNLGMHYLEGDGIPADPERGRRLLARACGAEAPLACATRGRHALAEGDLAGAYVWFQRGCEADHIPSCNLLGETLSHPDAPRPDPDRAYLLWQNACERRSLDGCRRAAARLADPSLEPTDREAALETRRTLCLQGHGGTCRDLGLHLIQDANDTEDVEDPRLTEGLEALRTSCISNHPPACLDLADLLDNDPRVPADPERSLRLIGMACQMEVWEACEMWEARQGE